MASVNFSGGRRQDDYGPDFYGQEYDSGTGQNTLPVSGQTTIPTSPFTPNTPIGGTGYSTPGNDASDIRKQLEAVSQGIAVTDQDVSDVLGYDNRAQRIQDFAGQYARRAAPKPGSQTNRPNSGSSQPFNTSPQFSDPAAGLMEDYALDRFNQRVNPNPASGTAMYEQYARELAETLGRPVYSAQDEAVLKTKATDAIMREYDATKRRWIEEVSRRGLRPTDGPALEGLRKIDQHYETLRTQVEADFARDAIAQTRQQRFQRADVLGNLAGSEEGRLSDAVNYARIPLGLQDRAFQMGQQLVGSGGNPANAINSALSFLDYGQRTNLINSQNRAQWVSGLMQYLGYLFD